MDIRFEEAASLKDKPQGPLGFGKLYTDYMYVAEYDKNKGGWWDQAIVPFGPIEMSPASMVLHYAQETFEGLKAYRTKDGAIQLFRPEMNARRFINSNERMSMPAVPEDMFVNAVRALVEKEADWVPSGDGESLYIRPYMFATEEGVGVHPSAKYKFIIIASPSGAYYASGVNPVKIWVEDEYIRAAPGGTGFTKCGGNYAGSLKAQEKAEAAGYDQVLWLDGVNRKYVEEVGSMNVMFLIDGKVVTAPTDGTVLPGVTRDSILHLLREWGYEVEERHMAIDELMAAARDVKLQEAGGTGTAAVISPIGELCYKGEKHQINGFKTGDLTQKLYDTLTGIQWGELEDPYGWTQTVTED